MDVTFQYDVFLSHSAKDKAVVRAVAERLRKDGLEVWFDEWVLKPGDSIPAKIEEGLGHSRVLVLCMSANAFGSDWAQLEADTFRFRDPLNKKRRFIPLRLDDAPIKGSLAQFLFINWLPEESKQEYGKLLEACRLPGRHGKGANAPMKQEPSAPQPRSLGDAWSGLRGVIERPYSTKIIKGILGKAGLPISKISYTGTFKGPVLDEADSLVSSLNDDARGSFVVACVQEILAFERVKAANLSQMGREPDDGALQDLRLVLARFGHDLKEFAPA